MLEDNQLLIRSKDSSKLRKKIVQLKAKNILLITGKKSFEISGAKKYIKEVLKTPKYTRFSDFSTNPKYEDVVKGIGIFNKNKFDLVIAIGGGSSIDMAKLICSLSNSNISDYKDIIYGKKKSVKKNVPLIAIPTTSGTGSEATHFAVVYVNNIKYSLANSSLLPNIVVLNTDLLKSQTPYLRAVTGLDAFSQAIESFWAVNSTNESKNYAQQAITLLVENLEKLIQTQNETVINNVSYASYLAGKAINISKTTAPHAISYTITSLFNIPHGHAVFMTLPKIMLYNYDINITNCNDERGFIYVKKNMQELFKILNTDNISEAYNKLKNLVQNLGIELDFNKNGISNKDIDVIINSINLERAKNNPRNIEIKYLKEILSNKI